MQLYKLKYATNYHSDKKEYCQNPSKCINPITRLRVACVNSGETQEASAKRAVERENNASAGTATGTRKEPRRRSARRRGLTRI